MATRALALDPADAQVERLGSITLALGVGRLRGAPAGLDRLAERLPQPAEAVPVGDADLLVTRGSLGFYAGRTTAAIADLPAAINLGRQGAVIAQLDRAHFHLANLLLNSGEWDEALVHARVALSVVADERRVWMEAQAHAAISGLLALRWRMGRRRGPCQGGRGCGSRLGHLRGRLHCPHRRVEPRAGPKRAKGGGRRASPVGGERRARWDHHVYLAWVVANPDRGHRRMRRYRRGHPAGRPVGGGRGLAGIGPSGPDRGAAGPGSRG